VSDQPSPTAAVRAALTSLWDGVRLAFVDAETCYAADGHHIVELGILSYRRQRPVGSWVRRFQPGVPVDTASHNIHHIADDDLADEDPFHAHAAEVARVLTPPAEERVVLVAHNAVFDVGCLHREFLRAHAHGVTATLPDVPVLDTLALARLFGFPRLSLEDLLDQHGLTNRAPHSAGGDIQALADLTLRLLTAAAERGHRDLDQLIAAVLPPKRGRTSGYPAIAARARKKTTTGRGPGSKSDATEVAPLDLPADHLAGHATVLPTQPTPAELAAWLDEVKDCAQRRCPYLADRVQATDHDPATLLTALEPLLDALLTTNDPPATATLLGSLHPLLAFIPTRAAALAWHRRWGARLNTSTGCPAADPCPSCREHQPCSLDTWHQPLAAAALGSLTGQAAKSFLRTAGADAGRGVFTTWHTRGHRQLADHAAWLVHQHWLENDQATTAELVAYYAWQTGGRDPSLAAWHAQRLAARGGLTHFQAALAVCDEALLSAAGSTDDGWKALRATRARIAGQHLRAQPQPSGDVDGDGNPIPARRHHPHRPERTRPGRFQPRRSSADMSARL
jgi:DNA polymerase III epsilon subunit-like protein